MLAVGQLTESHIDRGFWKFVASWLTIFRDPLHRSAKGAAGNLSPPPRPKKD